MPRNRYFSIANPEKSQNFSKTKKISQKEKTFFDKRDFFVRD
jgi:hypothetical protein